MFLPATIVVLVVFAVHCIHAATDKDGNCSNIEPMPDLNSTQLAGEWYWILTTKPGGSEAEGIKCTKSMITVDDSGTLSIVSRSLDIVTGEPVYKKVIATPIDGVRSRLSAISDQGIHCVDTILATDYKDYVILFIKCPDDPPTDFFQVFSQKLVSVDTYDKARRILDSRCTADDLQEVDQVNCIRGQE